MWKFMNGKFTYLPRVQSASVVSTPTTTTTTTTPANQTSADSGTFVDADGLPSNGDVVAGVAQNGQIVSHGITDVWVVDTTPIADLSGVYKKFVNGMNQGMVVLNYDDRDRSFTIASTKSNEIDFLKARLDALTTA